MEDKPRSLIFPKSNLSKEVLLEKAKIVSKALRDKKQKGINLIFDKKQINEGQPK